MDTHYSNVPLRASGFADQVRTRLGAAALFIGLSLLFPAVHGQNAYVQHNLVSDLAGQADRPDSIEDHGLFGSMSVASSISLSVGQITDSSVNLQWSGGTAPYLVQRRISVADTNWFNVLTTTNATATVANDGVAGFYRVLDHATNSVTAFTVRMTGDSEVPAVNEPGAAYGIMSLEGNTLSYQIEFSGLSGAAQAAHIHGPADTTLSVGVITPLTFSAAPVGALSGKVDVSGYTPDQLTALKSGRTYVNIHTAAHGGGEIRGQIVPVEYSATLAGSGEVPPVETSGAGSASLRLVGRQLFWDVTYTGLSSGAVAAHVHGPASLTESVGVLFGIGSPTGTSGSLSGTQTLTREQFSALVNGLTYVNVHTTTYGGGEIRGQIVPR